MTRDITATLIGVDGSRWDILHGDPRTTLAGIRGLGMPKLDYATRSFVTDGQVTDDVRLKERDLFLPLHFRNSDVVGRQRQFWSALNPVELDDQCRIEVTDGHGGLRYLDVRFVDDGGMKLTRNPYLGVSEAFGLTFVADDPWWHSARVRAQLQLPQPPKPFLSGDPFFISSSYFTAYTDFVNPGDARAWPVWEIEGADSAGVTGYELTVDGSMISGSTSIPIDHLLVINTDPRELTVTLSGPSVNDDGDRAGDLIEADFASVARGDRAKISAVLTGSGIAHVSISPRFLRGL